ncbi:histone-lysine N-methyltransferase SETMAR [Trichonephila clavata]|uniref:Histone-lysine N-methyltransferase SETMAR n=1 Tax=Trichonephila clavata TaxID=2740835 RepID=A0A8X6J6Q1_TRICU|nr:histone-lysine N-methyltransferase SETMAR [Trichonephila clavata]
MRHALLFLFNLQAVESHAEHVPSIRSSQTRFPQFKSGDFNLKDSESSGIPQSFKNEQLQELLDDNPTQIQQQLVKALNVSQETISSRLRAM